MHAVKIYSLAAQLLQLHCVPWHGAQMRSLVGVGFTDSTVIPPTHCVKATQTRFEKKVGARVSYAEALQAVTGKQTRLVNGVGAAASYSTPKPAHTVKDAQTRCDVNVGAATSYSTSCRHVTAP